MRIVTPIDLKCVYEKSFEIEKEVVMMAEEQPQILSREQLYFEVWEMSLAGVARKYSVSYGLIYKLCKEVNVPIPPSGYWTKLNFGKSVSKTPLPDSSINEVAIPRAKAQRIKEQKLDKGMTSISGAKFEAAQQNEEAIDNTDVGLDDVLKAGLDTGALPLSKLSKTEKYIDNRKYFEAVRNRF